MPTTSFCVRAIFATLSYLMWLELPVIGAAEPVFKAGDRILFLGDSITEDGAEPGGYVKLVQEAIRTRRPDLPVEIVGAGISGNRVPDLEARLDRDVLAKRPNVVVVYIGINDVWHSLEGKGTPKDAYSQGLERLLSRLKESKARVILCTPSVIGERRDGTNPLDAMLDEYSAISRHVAKESQVQLLDLRKLFIERLKQNNPNNVAKGILTHDEAHLNAAGNRFVADCILDALGVPDRAAASEKSSQIELFGVFERKVVNAKTYSNPFDFQVVELTTEFTAPSGKRYSFFGFYDGDGKGGDRGPVWRFRWMPDEVGTWRYKYSWTDGTKGEAGQFTVEDTGLAGPLQVASDNSWYFMTARGKPFDARPYGMHHWLAWSKTHRMADELDEFRQALRTRVIDRGYNMVMWPDMGDRTRRGTSSSDVGYGPLKPGEKRDASTRWTPMGKPTDSWWANATDTQRFSIAAFRANEDALDFCRRNGVYAFTFSGLVDQDSEYDFDDFRVFLRYFVARMAPYGNYFGWSPVWEWMDIWRPEEVSQIMQYIHDHDPWKRLLTAHDCSHSTFTGWLGFSMRQAGGLNFFPMNSRRGGGQQIADPNGSGGIGDPFIDRPIIASEDMWESPPEIADKFPGWGVRNGIEAMRASWSVLLGGMIPLYDEWNTWTKRPAGNGEGEPYVRRMFDFWYTRTQYRRYRQLNEMVSRDEQQIASGIVGEEYIVYDQDGGPVALNLSDVDSDRTFVAIWYDPASGAEQDGGTVSGGASRSLVSPFPMDSVLFLRRAARDAPSNGRK
ncbi:MAG: DUF459 domain-containing protein [Planctomycetaceae bacterium]